jgi:adenylate kinase
VVRRIQVYLDQTAPLIEYYRKRGVLAEIDGTQAIPVVAKALLAVVKK